MNDIKNSEECKKIIREYNLSVNKRLWSTWSNVIDFFNNKRCGKYFTRAEMYLYFDEDAPNRPDIYNTYRNTLERAGFLETVEPGLYRKIKKIPSDLSLYKARQMGKTIRPAKHVYDGDLIRCQSCFDLVPNEESYMCRRCDEEYCEKCKAPEDSNRYCIDCYNFDNRGKK